MADVVISKQLRVHSRCFLGLTHSAAGWAALHHSFEYMPCTLHGVMGILETLAKV